MMVGGIESGGEDERVMSEDWTVPVITRELAVLQLDSHREKREKGKRCLGRRMLGGVSDCSRMEDDEQNALVEMSE
jgi:hypothetical protein